MAVWYISVTSIWLSGVLRILSHSDLALGAQVVIRLRDLGMCLTLIADLCLIGMHLICCVGDNLCPAIWQLNPVLPADNSVFPVVFLLHVGLLVRLQLVLLL